MSSRKFKNIVGPAPSVLDMIEATPVRRWKYKKGWIGPGFDENEHVGPMAEDFDRIIGGDGSAEQIDLRDAVGVLFKAVQELRAEIRKLRG
jgi:hypothetical protein